MSNFLSRLFKPSNAQLEKDLIKLFYRICNKYNITEKTVTELLEQQQRNLHPYEGQAQAAIIYNLANLLPRHYKQLNMERLNKVNSSDAMLKLLTIILIDNKYKGLNPEEVNKIITCKQPFWQLKPLFDKLLPEQTLTETHQLAFV